LSKFLYLANKSSFYNRLVWVALNNITLGYTISLIVYFDLLISRNITNGTDALTD